jgi:hypothetical protein
VGAAYQINSPTDPPLPVARLEHLGRLGLLRAGGVMVGTEASESWGETKMRATRGAGPHARDPHAQLPRTCLEQPQFQPPDAHTDRPRTCSTTTTLYPARASPSAIVLYAASGNPAWAWSPWGVGGSVVMMG